MFTELKQRCDLLVQNFDEIGSERKEILEKLAAHIQDRIDQHLSIQLNYICTHNSRRSHLGQVWAATAASYYKVSNVTTFSGGTEATSFHPNAIETLKSAGFRIVQQTETSNPVYHVYSDEQVFNTCFSKVFDAEENPKDNFVAVMTCSDADQNCPFISGCDVRIGTTYNDPKAYDNSIMQTEKYTERSNQIALECLYVFSKIKTV